MKKFISRQDGYITVEASIITAILLIIIFIAISLLFRVYSSTSSYCKTMEENSLSFSTQSKGNVLRIVKVISETGGRLVDEMFNEK